MKTPEILNSPKVAWVFDVDGVITNPQTKRIDGFGICDELISKLQKHEPVALITGRAYNWVTNRVVNQIEGMLQDKSILDNLFISAEFGGFYSQYENGERKELINEQLSLPAEIPPEVKKIVENEYSDTMFVDPDKKTMVSVEMRDNHSVEDFKSSQKKLSVEIQNILNQYDKDSKLEIHEDTIATNIRNKSSNKKNAAEQMLKWLSDKGIRPQKYLVFGDSRGDIEIAQDIYENNLPIEFIYVGKEEIPIVNFPVKITKKNFEKGTLEYLKTL
jgi:hypothetical protein